MCVCVCLYKEYLALNNLYAIKPNQTKLYIYIYIYVCVCVCVCVYKEDLALNNLYAIKANQTKPIYDYKVTLKEILCLHSYIVSNVSNTNNLQEVI